MGAPAATELEEQVWTVSTELTEARKRGLDELDAETGRKHRLPLPELETLARRYTGDDAANRMALIRRLLGDALDAWAQEQQGRHADDALFLRDLFFAKPGASAADRQATKLLHDVMRGRGLTEDRLDDRRRATLRLFARFLIGFVDGATVVLSRGWVRRHVVWLIVGGALALVAGLAVAWLVLRPPGSASPGVGSSGATGASAQAGGGAVFTFDALGGGSPIINVYPGVSDSPADRTANGTYSDGQTAPAVCQTTGRTVKSDVSAGEVARQSDVWVKIVEQSGLTHYATLVYGDIDQAALAALPAC
jgi:hypothetical protein